MRRLRPPHALSWGEAFYLYQGDTPVCELGAVLEQRGPELAQAYDFTCGAISDRIAFLARHAGRAMPDYA
jgi:hypothetical protein